MSQMNAQVDKLLTEVSDGYVPEGFICEQLLPVVKVKQFSGLLGAYGDSHLRIESSVLGGRGEARRVESVTRSTSQYLIDSHALEEILTPRDYINSDKPFDAERDTVMALNTMLYLEKEKALADSLGDTAVLTQNTTLSGTSQYSDYTNSDPLADFSVARKTVHAAVGKAPDTAVMSWDVFDTLRFHPGILDALGFSANRAGMLEQSELARALNVKRILIGEAQYNSAKEGQSDVRSDVWGKNIIFAVAPAKAEKYQTSLGYRMELMGKGPRRVYKTRVDNPPESTRLIVADDYQQLLSKTSAAYLIKDAIA